MFPGHYVSWRRGAKNKEIPYRQQQNRLYYSTAEHLFFGASIATCIMVLKHSKATNDVIFIDASNEFIKVTNNNKLTDDNIDRILQAYIKRENEEHFAKIVPNEVIGNEEHNYNLSVSTYVEQKDTREKIDIVKLNAELKEIVAREQVLRDEIDKIIAEIEG